MFTPVGFDHPGAPSSGTGNRGSRIDVDNYGHPAGTRTLYPIIVHMRFTTFRGPSPELLADEPRSTAADRAAAAEVA